MTIKIYPSRLPGEPLETHEHAKTTIHRWLSQHVTGYTKAKEHPISVDIDGVKVLPESWNKVEIYPGTDVRIYPVPGEAVSAFMAVYGAYVALAVAVAAAAYSIYMMSTMDTGGFSTSTGSSLDLNPAKANSAKLGDPIREVFGRNLIYPDYLVQPVGRFDPNDPQVYTMHLFLSVGVGRFSFTNGDIEVGNTPINSLGDDFSYAVYQPGVDVYGDERSENWFASTEVGGTTSGSGLDMGNTGPESDEIIADAMSVSAHAVTFNGLDTEDDDDDDADDNALPDSWIEGAIVELSVPDSFTVANDGSFSRIFGESLNEIQPYIGMPVEMDHNGATYDLFIASYNAGSDATEGSAGSAAAMVANSTISSYDFTSAGYSAVFSFNGNSAAVDLNTNYSDLYGLISHINSVIGSIGLSASDNAGRLTISETSSPYAGGSIITAGWDSLTFTAVAGGKTVSASSHVIPNLTLAYDSATGNPFYGLPEGVQRLAISHYGKEYKILTVDGTGVTVTRMLNSVEDNAWPGFSARTVLDFYATGINESDRWLGPFLACPTNETVDAFEVNFSFPSGLCGFDSSGNKRIRHTGVDVQYRIYGSENSWETASFQYAEQIVSGLGYTHRITLASPGLVEVRVRRQNEQGSNNSRDNAFWQVLRGRLNKRPLSYANITSMGVSVVTGGKLAAQSDRRVNIVATRDYDYGENRTISGAIYHVLYSLGFIDSEIDKAAIDALEATYWTPRSEFFDYQTSSSDKSALDILQTIANAGMGYFLLSDGMTSVGREGVKPWVGSISPQETTDQLQTAFSVPSQDDYDGVDVTYINGTTWVEETVQCRTSNNPTPSKIESYTLDGVIDEDRAYRIGMRRLMKYLHQRYTHTTTTEMDALCYNFGDRLVLADDIPGNDTTSALIVDMEYDEDRIILVSNEPLDWTINSPRVLIRYQDGTASMLLVPTKVDDFTLSIPYSDDISPETWIMDDGSVEPPRLIFCSSDRELYHALLSEVSPGSDGTCQVTAKQYKTIFYDYDDATYPGDVA